MYSEELIEALETGIDRDMAEILASEIDDITEASPDSISCQSNPKLTSMWCEVEVIDVVDISSPNGEIQAPYTRIFMRNDVIQDPDCNGVLYRLLIETGLLTTEAHHMGTRKAVMMNILEDPEEPPQLFQSYHKNPAPRLTTEPVEPLADMEGSMFEQIEIGSAFKELVDANFVRLQRLTKFEFEELYTQIDLVARAKKNQSPPKDN